MIEPQNTMMPLAADPAPVEVPHGDAGFGEMLAQTLGMIPQIDPNAIQKIAGQQGNGEGEPGDLAEGTGGDIRDGRQPTRPIGQITLPGRGHFAVVRETPVERPVETPIETPPSDGGAFLDPVYDERRPPVLPKVPEPPVLGPESGTLPQPPAGGQLPGQSPAADHIGDPVVSGGESPIAGESRPTTPQPPADPGPAMPAQPPLSEADPLLGPDPIAVTPVPRPEPPQGSPISPPVDSDRVDAPVRSAPATPIATKPLRPVGDPPAPPAPPLDRVLTTESRATAARPAEIPASPSASMAAPRPPAGTALGAEGAGTVRIGEAGIHMPSDGDVAIGDRLARVEAPNPTAAGAAPQHFAVEQAPQPAATVTPVSAPSAPVQHSALAERVMQAVEMQANQPPPRTMVVDIPEIEGLRLVVSVRSGSEVHVVPATASTATNGVQPFLDELQGVLENRGFEMTGDGRRRNGQPQEQDEAASHRPVRPTFRRPQPSDNDLRI